MAVRAVVFDIGGVLEVTPDLGMHQKWLAQLGLPEPEYRNRTDEIWRAGSIGGLSLAQVHDQLAYALNVDAGTVDALMDDHWTEYLGTPNTDLVEYARSLRPRYRTGILSNSFVGAREKEQQAFGFEDLVDVIVYSHEVGFAKPDRRVYKLTCDRLGLPAGETAFIDDVEANVDGARAYGIRAVRYKDNTQVIADVEALLAKES